MVHEKIINRANWDTIRIEVALEFTKFGKPDYIIAAYRQPLGEKEYKVSDPSSYLTDEEILESKMELWDKLKPTL